VSVDVLCCTIATEEDTAEEQKYWVRKQ